MARAANSALNFDAQEQRNGLLARLLDHCERIPDPQEVFELLDLLRDLNVISPDEAASMMHHYWKGC